MVTYNQDPNIVKADSYVGSPVPVCTGNLQVSYLVLIRCHCLGADQRLKR